MKRARIKSAGEASWVGEKRCWENPGGSGLSTSVRERRICPEGVGVPQELDSRNV